MLEGAAVRYKKEKKCLLGEREQQGRIMEVRECIIRPQMRKMYKGSSLTAEKRDAGKDMQRKQVEGVVDG